MTVSATYGISTLQGESTGNGFTGGSQTNSDVIGLANGGYAVAYRNPDGTGGEDFPIFSIRNSAFTQTVGTGIAYGPGGVDLTSGPEMVRLANGNIAIVWDEGPGASSAPTASNLLVGAIINPITGSVIHSEFTVSPFASDRDPEVAALSNGNWVVAMTNNSEIYLQLMSPTGARLGGQISTGIGTDVDPVITGLRDGGFAIAFVDSADSTVHVQTFSAAGVERTANPVLVGATGLNLSPSIAALPDGNFALVYDDTGWGEPGLTLQIVNANGTNVTSGSYIRVDTPGATNESNPDVTVLPDGQILVTWEHFFSSTDHDIYARLFSSTGVPVAVNGTTSPFSITASLDQDGNPSIAQIRQGVFVTSWTDAATDGSGGRITTEVNEIVRTVTSDGANDSLTGSAIRDIFDGNGGRDTVSYASSDAGVRVDLQNGVGTGGHAQNDTYTEVENVIGSNFGDTIIGNGDANAIAGRGGADVINGGAGNDVMNGGAGDDTFYIGSAADRVIEASGAAGGMDTVIASVSYTLAADAAVERFVTSSKMGTTALNFTGNDFAQTISGNYGANILIGDGGNDVLSGLNGADRLYGGLGNDTLLGGLGNDLFIFNSAPNSTTNRDIIADFGNVSGNNDTIYLQNSVFTALAVGSLGGAFAANTTGTAAQADDRIIYETDTGRLFYDSNGLAAGGSVLFATLTGHPALTVSDFVVY